MVKKSAPKELTEKAISESIRKLQTINKQLPTDEAHKIFEDLDLLNDIDKIEELEILEEL